MEPPVIGAALTLAELPGHLDWLLERDRDLELQDFCEPGPLPGDWRDIVASARRTLGGWKGRLGIHGPFYGFDLATRDAGVRAIARKRLDERLELCASIGARWMVIHSPVRAWDHFNRFNWPDAEDRLSEAFVECVGSAVRRAEVLGVSPVLENVEDVVPDDRLRLCAAVGSPALGQSIDTGHAHYAHSVSGRPPVDYWIRVAGAALAHVHLQDSDGRADRHWPPGEG